MTYFVRSSGVLRYSLGAEGPRLVVEVDENLAKLARKLIPSDFKARPTRYPPHITVVRREDVNELWSCHEGKVVQFEYSPLIHHDETYFWYRAISQELVDIRAELGLCSHTEFTRAPDGYESFHITVANRKNVIAK